jgi:hypothetical protein
MAVERLFLEVHHENNFVRLLITQQSQVRLESKLVKHEFETLEAAFEFVLTNPVFFSNALYDAIRIALLERGGGGLI